MIAFIGHSCADIENKHWYSRTADLLHAGHGKPRMSGTFRSLFCRPCKSWNRDLSREKLWNIAEIVRRSLILIFQDLETLGQ